VSAYPQLWQQRPALGLSKSRIYGLLRTFRANPVTA